MLNQFIKSDLLGGVLWFILGMAICVESIKLKIGTFHAPGPGFIGFLSGAALGFLGLALMLVPLAKGLKKGQNGNTIEILGKLNWRRLVLVAAVLWAYILAFQPVGFLLSTFLFFFTLLSSSTMRNKWLVPLIISGCAAILGHFVFSTCLGVQLPKGILRF